MREMSTHVAFVHRRADIPTFGPAVLAPRRTISAGDRFDLLCAASSASVIPFHVGPHCSWWISDVLRAADLVETEAPFLDVLEIAIGNQHIHRRLPVRIRVRSPPTSNPSRTAASIAARLRTFHAPSATSCADLTATFAGAHRSPRFHASDNLVLPRRGRDWNTHHRMDSQGRCERDQLRPAGRRSQGSYSSPLERPYAPPSSRGRRARASRRFRRPLPRA